MLAEVRLICADAIEGMRQLPDESVHCIVTSPPYFGLRDYGVEGQIGLEEVPDCGLRGSYLVPALGCGECYVCKLVAVFREARRVLRKDGTLWLNLGDSYAAVRSYQVSQSKHPSHNYGGANVMRVPPGCKPKDLIGIPWMVAFALRDDGWWLRSEIIWHKPNCLPESVTDRPTRAHETVFLFAKSRRYFYDADAIKEPLVWPDEGSRKTPAKFGGALKHEGYGTRLASGNEYLGTPDGKRNKRSVWIIPTEPFPESHFAVMPQGLAEICILAGTSEYGVCSRCGAPLERVVERKPAVSKDCPKTLAAHRARGGTGKPVGTVGKSGSGRIEGYSLTRGWRPTCSCGATEVVPATVLDPFCGSGTTLLVAQRLGRHSIGIDINPAYIEMARRRTAQSCFVLTGGGVT